LKKLEKKNIITLDVLADPVITNFVNVQNSAMIPEESLSRIKDQKSSRGDPMKEQNVLARTDEQQTSTKFALFKNKSFLLVWLAGIFTSLAGSVYTLTVSWYVVKETVAGDARCEGRIR
jgi:hypothetical protein